MDAPTIDNLTCNGGNSSLSFLSKYFQAYKDPDIDKWFLMNSPVQMLAIIILYVLFVLRVGPNWMVKRPPFELNTLVIIYNIIQVMYSFFICFIWPGIRIDTFFKIITNPCHVRDPDLLRNVAVGGWYYCMAKFIELIDTVFFILRKKNSQVTGLHVYHHATTALYTWLYLKYVPVEQGAILGFLNSFVHIFMYFYYLIASLGPSYRQFLWWKKYITVVQLVQFSIMLVYLFGIFAMNCPPSKGITVLFFFNTALFFYLFLKFYIRSYKKMKKVT